MDGQNWVEGFIRSFNKIWSWGKMPDKWRKSIVVYARGPTEVAIYIIRPSLEKSRLMKI